MSATETSSIDIIARCLCRAHTFTALVPRSELPLKASYCHCTSCRHQTGALHTSDAPWHGSMEEVLGSSLKRYQFSGNVDVLFCGTCSTTMFFHEHFANQPESVGVFLGTLLNHREPNLVKIVDHIFVGDTVDGGATPWLKDVNPDGIPARCWKGGRNKSEQLEGEWPPLADLMKADGKTGPETFSIRCHCRGVDLVLRRADADFAAGAETPWFIDPKTQKHLGTFDSCDSCRSTFGIDVIHWTFVLLKQIGFASATSAFPRDTVALKEAIRGSKDSKFGTLTFYESSSDVQRYFCSRCSASVFYAVDDRPEMINLAVGLLDAPEGARAESLLTWSFGSSVGYSEDAQGGWREAFVAAVQRNAEAWRVKRGYPKSFRRIMKEEADSKKEQEKS